MLKLKLIGVGAAGNKAAIAALEQGAVAEDEIMLLNSYLGDIPAAYQQYGLKLSDKILGTGKERRVARTMTIEYLEAQGTLVDDFVREADLVCVVNSTEGGNGSGASSVLYKYLLNVCNKNVLGFVFTGFEEDGRGLKNTLEYFNDLDPNISVQVISNKKFLPLKGKNKLRAERQANDEFVKRLRIVRGQQLVDSIQNIDQTELLKLVTTPGYLQVEHLLINEEPDNVEQFNQLVGEMLRNSKALPTTATCKRLGVMVCVTPKLQEIVDYDFEPLLAAYGTPYEIFTHVQDTTRFGNELYVLAAGLEMPLEAAKAVFESFKAKVQQVAKEDHSFTDFMKGVVTEQDSGRFNMQRREALTPEELAERKKEFADMV